MQIKPVIGITASYDQNSGRHFLPEAYLKCVIEAGGVPVILPGLIYKDSISAQVPLLQGLILSGGVDIDPKYFDAEPSPFLGEISPERDELEISLLQAAVQAGIPVLGICRGAQVINVAFGGSLCQHIPIRSQKAIQHSQNAPRWYGTHNIHIFEETLLFKIVGHRRCRVNSFHHQAIQTVAKGFVVSAKSKDGVIEAIESEKGSFLMGVQWHPEAMTTRDESARLLLRKFVKTCSKVKKQKKSAN